MRMRILRIAVAFLFVVPVLAQERPGREPSDVLVDDPCLKLALMDSCGLGSVDGKVLELAEDLTLTVRTRGGVAKRVVLAGIASAGAPAAAHRWLRTSLLGNDVSVSVFCASRADDEQFEGVVRLERRDLNLALLEQGLARYRDSGALLGSGDKCRYRRAEDEAKKAGVGIWASAEERPN